MKTIQRIIGTTLSLIGFVGLFCETEQSWKLQLLWTLSAASLLLIGAYLMDRSGAFSREEA